jgi:hypothetical protein
MLKAANVHITKHLWMVPKDVNYENIDLPPHRN